VGLPQRDLPDSRPEPVAQIVQALADATAHLEALPDADAATPLVRLLRSAIAAIPAVEPLFAPGAPAAEVSAWRHELRAHVTAMAGWAMIFGWAQTAAARQNATAAVERNGQALARLLAHPPA
jgi:hypothetical protein